MATTAATSATTSTNIDVNSIVSQLMTVERQPITKLNTKEASYNAKLTALGLIKSQVSNFQTAVQSLGSSSSSSLLAFKATSSDTTAFSASADSTAVAGTYSLNVTTLAQANKLAAAGQASDTSAIATGTSTVTFVVGTTSTNIPIAAGATLQDVRTAINAANIGVTATIVNDGNALTPYRLALSANASGVSNAINSITIQAGGDAAINDLLAYNPTANVPTPAVPMTQTVAAQNANFTVNGVQISKASNTVTDAIQGVTLTLSKEATPATLTVTRDSTAVTSAVTAFVKAYNDMYTALKNSSAYSSTAALAGDSSIRTIQAQLRSIASAAVSGGTMTQLFEVGVSSQADGTLKLDSAKLSSAMSTNFSDVAHLFNSATVVNSATGGYATQFDAWATRTLAIDGIITNKTNGFNQSIKNISAQRSTLETRMVGIEKRYRTQFSALDGMLTSMNNTSTYLTQQLARL